MKAYMLNSLKSDVACIAYSPLLPRRRAPGRPRAALHVLSSSLLNELRRRPTSGVWVDRSRALAPEFTCYLYFLLSLSVSCFV